MVEKDAKEGKRVDSKEGKLVEYQEEYAKTKHNKATNKHLGILRAKMAAVRKAIEEGGKKGGGFGFAVKKTGNATVSLVGFPNAGKSSLLKILTGVESKVADYAFTTVTAIPGMLEYNGANIQFLDLPGLIQGAHIGKGGGREIISVIRVSDLILFVVDVNAPDQLFKLIDELNALNVRINKQLPRIRIEKAVTGGISIEPAQHKIPDKSSIIECMNGFGIFNGTIIFHQDATIEDVMEALAGNYVYIRGLIALNKIDTMDDAKVEKLRKDIELRTGMKVVKVSAAKNMNIGILTEEVFKNLNLVRVYLRPRDGDPDFNKPLILNGGGTLMDIAKKINSKTAKNVRFGYVTGKSAKFSNQKVGFEHKLADKDVVTLIYDKA